MSDGAALALFGLAFCGLIIIELTTGDIWPPGAEITRDKWPLMYWIMVGSHMLIAIGALGSATVAHFQCL